jgi:hypothetical protein
VLTDEEWDEVVALSGSSLTWVVTGTTSDGVVTRVATTNEIQHPTTDLATADATLLGWEAGSATGASLANVGDVDGDGQVDVLIGAAQENAWAGVVYLSTGPVTGTIDLADAATQFVGAAARDLAGFSVAGAGDVDADGYDDVIIGAVGYPRGPSGPGAAYLVLGPVTGSFDLSLADATFVGRGETEQAGVSVSSAGDMDGDGLPDVLVGAAWGPRCCTGAAYVVSGTRRGSNRLGTADAWMYGIRGDDYLGWSVGGLGDVDGDGLDDFLSGAFGVDGFRGVTYVFFGPAGGELDPFDADATLGGEKIDAEAGRSTGAAGDVDGDGLRDILIGAPGQDEAFSVATGAAYLVHGGVTGTLLLDDADAKLVGETEGDEAGGSVSGAGDVDADGHDDILVGAWRNDAGGTDAGAAYLVRGPVTGSLDLGRADRKLVGARSDQAGYAVSSAGDLDGDGRVDILVGAPGHAENGAAYVLYGSGL